MSSQNSLNTIDFLFSNLSMLALPAYFVHLLLLFNTVGLDVIYFWSSWPQDSHKKQICSLSICFFSILHLIMVGVGWITQCSFNLCNLVLQVKDAWYLIVVCSNNIVFLSQYICILNYYLYVLLYIFYL